MNEGWTHEEAKEHTIVERLIERCETYSPTREACINNETLPRADWCERCLAADCLSYIWYGK